MAVAFGVVVSVVGGVAAYVVAAGSLWLAEREADEFYARAESCGRGRP